MAKQSNNGVSPTAAGAGGRVVSTESIGPAGAAIRTAGRGSVARKRCVDLLHGKRVSGVKLYR
jgi:hypothetical protein